MKNIILTLHFGLAFLVPQVYAETDKEATADVNAVVADVSEDEKHAVAWFLIEGDAKDATSVSVDSFVAMNEINKIPNKGSAHDALVRLLGKLMERENAALQSRTYAYARLKAFAGKDPNAKKILEEVSKTIKARNGDLLAPKLK